MAISKDALPVSYAQPGLTINWGSILSGLVFILALGWLLFTLGSAIGMSIADVHNLHERDVSSKTAALGTAATVWILATVVATYFLGGFLAGKVSGRTDKSTGLLHGVVLWSCTIIIGIIFSAIGVSGIMNAAAGAAKSVTSTGAQAVSMMAGDHMTAGHKDIGSSQLAAFLHPLTGSLKQDLNKALDKARQAAKDATEESGAKNSTHNGSNGSGQNQSKDQDSSQSSATYQASNDDAPSTTARSDDASNHRDGRDNDDENAARTDDASDDESKEGREGQPSTRAESHSREDKEISKEKSDSQSVSKSYSHSAHHSTNARSVDRAIEKIDPQVLMAVAIALIQGDEKRAKGIITNHFDIDEADIDKLINAAKQKSEQAAKELEKKMNDAKDYAAGLLWVIFLSYLIGLLACISGAQLAMKSPNLLDTAGAKNSSDKKY